MSCQSWVLSEDKRHQDQKQGVSLDMEDIVTLLCTLIQCIPEFLGKQYREVNAAQAGDCATGE